MYAIANGDRMDQSEEIKTLKVRLAAVERNIEELQKGSELGFEHLRHRFLTTFKRDKNCFRMNSTGLMMIISLLTAEIANMMPSCIVEAIVRERITKYTRLFMA